MDPTEVIDDLRRVLKAVVDAAREADREIPERQLIAVGGLVYDCPMVSVLVTSMATGIVGAAEGLMAEFAPCPPVRQMSVEIAIVRHALERYGGPRQNLAPPPADLAKDVEDASRDVAIIFNAIDSMSGFAVGSVGTPIVSFVFQEIAGTLRSVVATATFNIGWSGE